MLPPSCTIEPAATDDAIRRTLPVMLHLRPDLDEATYLKTVRRMETSHGYRLLAVVEEGEVRAVAGYRFGESLGRGRFLYLDDLVTQPASRSRGFGKALLDRLEAEAVEHGCGQIHLESGVKLHAAHRLYFRERMEISSYHFRKKLG